MAFLDFMNQGIGGMRQAQGPNIAGEAGVGAPQPIGPTWGQVGNAAVQYGSRPGSSGPMIAAAVNRGYGQSSLPSLAPNAPMAAKQAVGQGREDGQDQILAQIAKFLMNILGTGAGTGGGV